MEFIENATTTASQIASIAWTILSAVSSGHPTAALVVVAAGSAWFAGVTAIIGSLV